MKINISDRARKGLTDDELKFLLLLELNPKFEELVNKARIELKIPVFEKISSEESGPVVLSAGKLINPESMKNSEVPNNGKAESETLKIVTALKIPITLFFAIKYLLVWGEVYDVDYPIGIYVDGNKRFSRLRRDFLEFDLGFPYEGLPYPIIQIKKRLTKDELFRHIEEHWFKLDKAMEALEKSANFPVLVSHISVRDIQEAIKIYKYREAGLKHKEIKSKLEEDKIYLDEPTIRKKYSQLDKILKKLGFVTN